MKMQLISPTNPTGKFGIANVVRQSKHQMKGCHVVALSPKRSEFAICQGRQD